MSERKELHDSPLLAFDQVSSFAPLCELLAQQKNEEDIGILFKTFASEQETIFKSLPNISSNRTVCRLNYALGISLAKHMNTVRPHLSPAEVVLETLKFIAKTSSLDETEIKSINDVPMENGFWAVELASFLEPFCREYKINSTNIERIRTSLVESFNSLIKFANNKSAVSEERTKNTLSTDIGKRMVEALRNHLKSDMPNDESGISKALAAFEDSITSYADWIVQLDKASK